jgi:carboxypeptidase Q
MHDGKTQAEQLRDLALAKSRAHDWVRELADGVGARLAGSPGDAKAVAWAKAKMAAVGLANVHTEPVTVTHWERGIETGEITFPPKQLLVLTALGGSVPTPDQGIEAELVELSSLKEADLVAEDKLRGKIAFFNQAMERTKSGESYGKVSPIRRSGASKAAARGAVGMVMRSLSTAENRLPHTGMMHYEPSSLPDADLLHRLLSLGQPVRVRFTLGCRSLPDAQSANVVGEVVGREKPDEVLLIGAHLDSWDLATGALDDGAGVGMVLEVGRLIAQSQPHPRRTIRIVLFANEEHGLNGAFAYAHAHEAELARHVAALELDHGTGRPYGVTYLGGPSAAGVMNEICAPLRDLGVAPPTSGGHGGADLIPLHPAGVPLISLQQDGTYYFDIHHSADDTFDKVDPASMSQTVAAATALVYGLADSPSDLGRVPEELRKERP